MSPPHPEGPRSAGPLLRALPWAALALVLAADVAAGGRQVLGLLVAPPLLAAALLTTRGTVAVGAATALAAVAAGAWLGTLTDAPQVARVVAVLGSAVAGWWACRLREQRSAQLVRSRELAAVTEKLRAREQQQAAVAALGVDALTGLPLGRLMQRASDVVEHVLDVDLCGVLRLEPGLGRLRLVAGTGWSPGAVGTATLPADATSQPGWTLAVDEPVVVPRVEVERRFGTAPLLADHGVASGVTVTVPGPEQPFGVLGAHSRRRRDFSDDDVAFLQLVAVVLGGAIERAGREDAMAHRVLHDSLTGLPNRTLLLDRLHQMYAARGRGRGEVVALFIDLDDFKPVNDTLGHEAGDELLVALAERLRGLVRPSDTVARLAGDEFVVALQEPAALEIAERLAGRVGASLARPFRLRSGQVTVSASIGMALGSMAEDPEALLANADAAMYQAKQSGAGLSAVYDEGLHGRHLRRLHVKQALRGAAERGELSLAYQPLVEIAGGRVGGVEALLRWRHPELGYVSPAEFIPLAEQTGAVDELGRWALHQACEDVARWQRVHGERTPVVHVNLSRRQLGDPGLLDAVRQTLDATGADPSLVGLEVTESAVLDDPALARTTLLALKALGLQVAMDDFGTGYSSLAQLTRLPVDSVKIDRALVSGLDGDGGDRAVVDGVLRMAGALGLTVTAEGVERPDQLFTLRQLGCSTAQGFFLARPAPAAAIEALLLAPEAPVTVLLPDTPGDLVDLTAGLASRA